MRYLCLDLGKKRIGVAVSDETALIATPLGTINVTSREQVFQAILRYLSEQAAVRLIIGLPLRLSGEEGIESNRAREFANAFAKRTDVPIYFVDERLSSVEASRMMQEAGVKSRKRRINIDAQAAAVILQAYLDTERSLSK